MGRTFKFSDFPVSYTVPDLPLPMLCLPIMLLMPCTAPPILPLPSSAPLKTLHVISFPDSVPLLGVCLVLGFF